MPSNIDFAILIDFITALAVVGGIAFGVLEIRHMSQNRRDFAAFDIVRAAQTQEVRQAVRRILSLPENADPASIRSDPELFDAALAVDVVCEMWGSLVFEGVAELHMLDRMIGGWVRGTWKRLHVWVESEREITGNPNIAEWWQWLYERLEEDPDPGKVIGAHIAYRGKKRR